MSLFSCSWKFLPALSVAVLLSGCLGSSDPAPSTLGGTAATGAPIVGGTVNVKCAGGSTLSDVTDSNGVWQVTISGQTLPCAVEVSGGNLAGGQTFHSLALQLGTVNITPLTDLMIANMAGVAPAVWFSGLNANAYQQISTNAVNAALANVRTAFNLGALNEVNPLTTAFTATSGNALDNILEAMSSAYMDYNALLNAAMGEGFATYAQQYQAALAAAFSALPSSGTGGSGGGGGTPTLTCNQSLFQANSVHEATTNELATYQKSYTGDVYTFNTTTMVSTGPTAGNATFNANGSLTLDGQTKVPTSICVDNVDGGSGITLYVHFADGHVDLWPNGTFSGSLETSGAGGSGGAGTSTLTVAVSINGVASPAAGVVIQNVPAPGSQTEFCNALQNDTTFTNIGTAAGGSLTINSCTYANNTGTISATLNITTPIALTVPYTVTYTYN